MNLLQERGRVLDLISEDQNSLATGFIWRASGGGNISPTDMETSHLFYTLRMIWNNKMPESMHVGRVKQYYFPEFYTDNYFKIAIISIASELCKRTDLDFIFLRQLEAMAKNFKAIQIESK